MRRAGYTYIRDRRSGQDSFVHRLGSDFYPRFHVYINEQADKIIFNLHLDQKQPSYVGAKSHNAEYDGANVVAEISRLKSFLTSAFSGENINYSDNFPMDKIGFGEYNKTARPKLKKSWWRRIFG